MPGNTFHCLLDDTEHATPEVPTPRNGNTETAGFPTDYAHATPDVLLRATAAGDEAAWLDPNTIQVGQHLTIP